MTALLLVMGDTIEQFVMSCRVFGMEVEKACVALACRDIVATGAELIKGRIQATGKNLLSMRIFAGEGFEDVGDGVWVLRREADQPIPPHIALSSV